MATKKTHSEDQEQAVPTEVGEGIVERAKEEGVSPEAAKEIVDERRLRGRRAGQAEGSAEAIRVEREDQEESGE